MEQGNYNLENILENILIFKQICIVPIHKKKLIFFIQNFLGIVTELTEKTEENVGLQVIIFIIQSYIKKDGFS